MVTEDRKLDYTGQDIYCGVDVHKRRWSMTSCTSHRIYKTVQLEAPLVPNTVKYLRKKFPGGNYHVAYEAGFSGFWAQRALSALGIDTIVVNPADIPTTHKQRDQKTDTRDSSKIARCLRSGELKGIYIPSVQAERDRDVIRERMNISGCERRIKHQIKSYLSCQGINIPEEMDNRHWPKRFISWLESLQQSRSDVKLQLMLDRLEAFRVLRLKALEELRKLRETDRHKDLYDVLISIPGVGMLTAMALIGEIIDMRRFRGEDELLSYIGLVPKSSSSGEKERIGQLTHRKNDRLLKHLIQASWMAIRSDQELMLKYEVYCKRMTGQKAIIKIAKILVRRIRCVWLNNEKYQKAEM